MRKIFLLSLLCFIAINLTSAQIFAQSKDIDQLERRSEKILEETQWRNKTDYNEFTYDLGGWLGYSFFDYEDQDNQVTLKDSLENLHLMDLRLWSRGQWRNGNQYYVRLKTYLFNYNYGANINADDEDFDGPHLEMAYMTFPVNERYTLTLGRQKILAGKGLAYNQIHDGIRVDSIFGNHKTTLSVAQTRQDEKDLDLSLPGREESERRFYLLQHNYTTLQGTNFYGYFLSQRDDNPESPADLIQDFKYNSHYWGFGVDGRLRKNLEYYLEYISENGESTASASTIKTGIDAWGGLAGLTWYGTAVTRPTIQLEWSGGSGDPDRLSVTNTINGNLLNTGDENFLYYGYWNTGLALSPRLSNMKVLKLGFTFKPFVNDPSFQDLLAGITWYQYDKWEATGGISDPEAVLRGTDVGNELDFSLNWKVYNDFYVYFNYAIFTPGNAYHPDASDKEKMLQTGFTVLF